MKDLLLENKGISYFDYNSLDKFPVSNDSLFFDPDHLNTKGAELFTKILVKNFNIKPYF